MLCISRIRVEQWQQKPSNFRKIQRRWNRSGLNTASGPISLGAKRFFIRFTSVDRIFLFITHISEPVTTTGVAALAFIVVINDVFHVFVELFLADLFFIFMVVLLVFAHERLPFI